MSDNGVKELLWAVAIFVGLGILWFVTGGANSAIHSIVNPTVTTGNGTTVGEAPAKSLIPGLSNISGADQNNGSNNTVYVSSFSYGNSDGSTISQGGSSGNGNTGSGQNTVSYDQSEYAWITNKSPYFKEITLGTGSIGDSRAGDEYLVLNASGNHTPIDITGWRLVSIASGLTATIGSGVILPDIGGSSIAQDIALLPGDSAYVVTGTSPVGYSFQENECTGYFMQFNNFNPGLNDSCPSINQKLPVAPNQLDDQCLDYLQSYPECQTQTNELPPGLSHNCQQFIVDHASYSQCIIDHKSDSDFYSHVWWIYLGRSQTLWKSERENIELLDKSGNVVDVVSY